jgi:hypothetical protein
LVAKYHPTDDDEGEDNDDNEGCGSINSATTDNPYRTSLSGIDKPLLITTGAP